MDPTVTEILALKKQIAEAEQIYCSFDSDAALQNQLKKQIDLLAEEIGG